MNLIFFQNNDLLGADITHNIRRNTFQNESYSTHIEQIVFFVHRPKTYHLFLIIVVRFLLLSLYFFIYMY